MTPRWLAVSLVWVLLLCGVPMTGAEEPEQEKSRAAGPEREQEETAPPRQTRAEGPAQEPGPAQVVAEIEVRGNQAVNTATILNKMRLRPGETLTQELVRADIKELYGTGFFRDIRTDVQSVQGGLKVIVVVEEKPVVGQVVIEGNTRFSTQKLREDVGLVEGQVLDENVLTQGVRAVENRYRDKGFKFIKVEQEVDVNAQTNQALIYVKVIEGDRFRIKDIRVEGNQAFKARKVLKQMRTKKRRLFFGGAFKEDQFEEDLDRVRLFYQKAGYLDVKVEPKFDYDEPGGWMFITLAVQEGKQYATGKVEIKGNVLFPESEIWQELEMLPAAVFSQVALEEDVARIRAYYFERGYLDAKITPRTQLNATTGMVDVLYEIQEGDLYFVEKVKVRGNTKTKDKVIRRELRLYPGERLDGKAMKRSKERLDNLGYFEDVNFETEETTKPNYKDVVVYVKEKRTGELSVGGGISSIDRFVAFGEIGQRNFDLLNWPRFTGGGQSLYARGRVGSRIRDLDFSFVEPYLFDKRVSFGLNIFALTRLANNVDFDEQRIGAATSFGRQFGEYNKASMSYTLERVELEDIAADAHPDVTAVGTKYWLGRTGFEVVRDSRDNAFNPTRGRVWSAATDFAASWLGGDESFYRWILGFSQYKSFFKKNPHVLEFRTRMGVTDEFGDSETVPITERFYAGGLGSVRGYGYRRVGPKGGGDAIGGRSLFQASLEYDVPIIPNFKGSAFVDMASVDEDAYALSDEVGVSVGPGMKIKTPVGPMAFYWGFPIVNKDDKNKLGRFEFSLSRGF